MIKSVTRWRGNNGVAFICQMAHQWVTASFWSKRCFHSVVGKGPTGWAYALHDHRDRISAMPFLHLRSHPVPRNGAICRGSWNTDKARVSNSWRRMYSITLGSSSASRVSCLRCQIVQNPPTMGMSICCLARRCGVFACHQWLPAGPSA